MMASDNICARLPATWVAWIHRIHAAGGASGSITMVVMFVVCLCCVFGLSRAVCKKVPEYNFKVQKMPYTLRLDIGLHHSHNLGEWFGMFNEDKFLVDKEGMGVGVSGQVMIDAPSCQCGGESKAWMSVAVMMEISVLMWTENFT